MIARACPAGYSLLAALILAMPLLWACNHEVAAPKGDVPRDTLYNPPIDSLSFWPPAMRYARAGDTVSIRMIGYQRGYTCGEITDLRWNWRDSTGHDYYTLLSTVTVPGGPSCERGGTFDSTFRFIFFSSGGEKLVIRHGRNVETDSLLFLSGFGYVETFVHHDSDPDSSVFERGEYRFTFLDSTATRRGRSLFAVLPACETLQSAIFKREGDSLIVRLRRIVAQPLPAALFPPCEGEHADTMEVVPDLYKSF